MAYEGGRVWETTRIEEGYKANEPIAWKCVTEVEDRYLADHNGHTKGDVVKQTVFGNLIMNGGASVMWERLDTLNPSTSATGAALQGFSSGTCRIGVGASTATAAVTQTDLQSTANKAYKGMDATYPAHTDGTSSSGARQWQVKATFSTAQANFAWNEWAVFNSTTATKRMLNRKVQSLGTKSSAATRSITCTLSLS